MGFYIKINNNVSDITYQSELIPPPLSYLAYAILKVVGG